MDAFFKLNTKNNLIAINVLLVFFLILLFNLGVLPFKGLGDFLFFVFLFFCFSLYRPGWAFLFFMGTIALENINLISKDMGLAIRPWQFLGFLIIAAVTIRFFVKRLNFELPKLKWFDGAVAVIGVSGFLSLASASDKFMSLKLSVVLLSFVALYFLTRVFIQTVEDILRVVPFFLGSGLVVASYGIWQNFRFMRGLESLEVMPGRSNATFTEPNWLGIFLVVLITAIYAIMYYKLSSKQNSNFVHQTKNNCQTRFAFRVSRFAPYVFCFLCLILIYVALILTVSRSAWLGMGIATLMFLVANLFSGWRIFLKQVFQVALAGIISLLIVYIFNLTDFQLLGRAQSAASGLQKITVSCKENINLPEKIDNILELEKYGCRHINLEEINPEQSQGNYVKEIYRRDPNVVIRSEIYKKSWEQIKAHPILGIGWGSISSVLGKDARGAGLNSSNIFLEIWLGSGILGLLAFLSIWVYTFLKSGHLFFTSDDIYEKSMTLFICISWIGFTVANLFNAGIMLGFLWVYLAIAASFISIEKYNLK